MKTLSNVRCVRLFGVIALVALIGFSMIACEQPTTDGDGGGGGGVAPTISTTTLPGGAVETEYSHTLVATGSATITWSIDTGSLPGGLTLSTAGVIAGTPTTEGTSTFTVKATNAIGSTTKALSITIAPVGTPVAPSITTAALPAGTVGTAYNQTLTATGSVTITWSIDTDSLPNGLSLSTAGVIEGTPTAAGTFNFTVKATNTAGNDTKALSIVIAQSGGGSFNPANLIGTWVRDDGTMILTFMDYSSTWDFIYLGSVNEPFSLQQAWFWDVRGDTLSSTEFGGTYSFKVAFEGEKLRVSEFTSTRSDVNELNGLYTKKVEPSITTTSLPGGTVGTAYSQTLTATGDAPITWSIESGSLPGGLSLSTAGVISGAPTTANTFTFTVKATNVAGSVTRQLSIVIGVVPTITTASLPNGTEGTAYSQTLAASGNTPITWSIESGSLPGGLSLSAEGVISGTPTTEGTSTFTVKATNAIGSGTRALSIVIVSATAPTVTNITLTTTSVKKAYKHGEQLDLTGLTVTAHYSNGTSVPVTGYTSSYEHGETLSIGTGSSILSEARTVTVTYEDKTAVFPITVTGVTNITLNTFSVKKTYYAHEPLDLSGLVVNAIYNSGAGAEVTGYTSEPANGTPLQLSTNGFATNTTVTISYTYGAGTRTAAFTVFVAPITYTVTQSGGTDGTGDSTGIVFTFNANVDSLNLSAADITVSGADKGAATLTGTGATRMLSNITVSGAGLATVSIAKNGIEAAEKGVLVYKTGQVVTGTSGLSYTLINGDTAYRVVGGVSGVVIVPATHNGLPVTEIGSTSDTNTTGVLSGASAVYIPASVTTIGSYAFSYSTLLKSVTFAENSQLQTIGNRAFQYSGLTSITIPAGAIGNSAFLNCENLTSVTICEGVTSIGVDAFSGGSWLRGITIPASVTSIGTSAFERCLNLFSVTFAENSQLQTIGTIAFERCSSLTSITIPANVTTIGQSAFSNCSNLRNIIIDTDTVTSYNNSAFSSNNNWATIFSADNLSVTFRKNPGNYAFSGAGSRLISVTLVEGITSIGNNAFYNCGFRGITIPASVTSIGSEAFYSCRSLDSITIPANVTTLGNNAFQGCDGLQNIIIDTDKVTSYNNSAFSSDNNWGTIFPCVSLYVTFRKTPGDYAFYGRTGLRIITIAEGITNIAQFAFYGCGLRAATIPASVTTIGNSAFRQCTIITSLTIPAGVTTIGNNAFQQCTGITSLTIPASVTTIGNNAFQQCTGITSLTIPASVTTVGSQAFRIWNNTQTIYVPWALGSTPGGWNANWNQGCNAQIVYQQ